MIDLLRPWILLLLPLPWLIMALRLLPPERLPATLILPQRLFALLATLPGVSDRALRYRRLRLYLSVAGWLALVLALATPLSSGPPLQQAVLHDLRGPG